MNSLTAIARIDRVDFRQTSDGRPMAVLSLVLMFGDGAQVPMNGTAYGGIVESLKAIDFGSIVLVSGELNMIQNPETKQTNPSIVVSTVNKVGGFSGGFAHISLTGNMGQDPDVKRFESGKNNAKSSLAVRRTKDQADWFAFECWGTTAEILEKYTAKGAKIGISGPLKKDEWTDRTTGEVRSKLVVVVRKLDLLGSRSDSAGTQQSSREMTTAASSTAAIYSTSRSASAPEPHFDDIPF